MARSINEIFFKSLTQDELPLLQAWFQVPHVLQWYARGQIYTPEMIRDLYLPRIENSDKIACFIIYAAESPIGYIQYYSVDTSMPEGVEDFHHSLFKKFKPHELCGIDLFIADEKYLRKGYASAALSKFIDTYLKPKFKAVVVDPLRINERAKLFFHRNNFEYLPTLKNQLHELMILELSHD